MNEINCAVITKNRDYKLEEAVIDPFSFSKHLVGSPLYSLRIGGYRVLMMIDIKTKIIAIERVGLRKNVHDKL